MEGVCQAKLVVVDVEIDLRVFTTVVDELVHVTSVVCVWIRSDTQPTVPVASRRMLVSAPPFEISAWLHIGGCPAHCL